MKRLAIVLTHPIQYYSPVFKLLAEQPGVDLKVFYTWGEDSIKPKFDPGFGKVIEWDIPLLEGYSYEFLENTSTNPGSSSFRGIINPDAISKIHGFDPNVILVYGWSNKSHLNILRHFKGKVPVWFRGDSNLIDQQNGWKQLLRGIFLRWVYSHVDLALYVGSANKAYFRKYGLREDQLFFAPHAVDNKRFQKVDQADVSRFRDDLGIDSNQKLILFAGKLSSKKNPFILLEAFSALKDGNNHLLYVGNGELEKPLKDLVKQKGLSNVHFLDFQNQQTMPLIYHSCDVFCLPSAGPGETWGLAVNEAMAAGKAIIVSDKAGCAKDLVIEAKNGFIFENQNQAALEKALNSAIGSEASHEMGLESKNIVLDWSFEKQVEQIMEALKRV